MTKNPIINAAIAVAYIVLVANGVFHFPHIDNVGSVLMPIGMISLVTLSVGVMIYTLLLKPTLMYIDGEKKAALKLFAQTLASFAVITAIIVAIILIRFRGMY